MIRPKTLLTLLLVCCPLGAFAQAGARSAAPSDLSMERIRANAAAIKDYLDLMSHPEQATRLAAFEELTNSKDPAAQEAAYAAAFASSEVALHAVALRKRLMRSKVVAMALQLVEERPRMPSEHVGLWKIQGVDEASGTLFIAVSSNTNAPPQLQPAFTVQGLDLIVAPPTGSVLDGRYPCRGRLTLAADSQLMSGNVQCFQPAGWLTYRATFNLR